MTERCTRLTQRGMQQAARALDLAVRKAKRTTGRTPEPGSA